MEAADIEVAGKVMRHRRKSLNAKLLRKHIIADSKPLQLRILTMENKTRALPGGGGDVIYAQIWKWEWVTSYVSKYGDHVSG